nr:8-hydroxygeraniol dehydrogenase-like [Ipomoea batatas]
MELLMDAEKLVKKMCSSRFCYCGICHSDLHQMKNEWGNTVYPLVPGHEIVGVVTEIGSKVEKFKVGDKIGVGCLVGSCRKCEQCESDQENYCPQLILTYNASGTVTFGGYSDIMVADEHFVVRWPENLPLEAAPLLCAGITTYSPMKYFGLDKPGLHIGVVGLGGLGHMALKYAKTFGCHVTVISTSASKKQEAIEKFGADSFLISLSAVHRIVPLLSLLKTNGKLVMVGAPEKPLELPIFPLLMGRKIVAGSLIGGIKETQEMLDFSAKHNVVPEVEVVPVDYANTAMERLAKADVKYRFVLDIGNTLKAALLKE